MNRAEYDPIHPPDAITTNLPKEKQCVSFSSLVPEVASYSHSLGPVEPDTVEKVKVVITDEENARLERVENRPPLDEILNLHDFEAIARQVMRDKAWAYYSSAADDEITNRENHAAYHRYAIRLNITHLISLLTIILACTAYGSDQKFLLM